MRLNAKTSPSAIYAMLKPWTALQQRRWNVDVFVVSCDPIVVEYVVDVTAYVSFKDGSG